MTEWELVNVKGERWLSYVCDGICEIEFIESGLPNSNEIKFWNILKNRFYLYLLSSVLKLQDMFFKAEN